MFLAGPFHLLSNCCPPAQQQLSALKKGNSPLTTASTCLSHIGHHIAVLPAKGCRVSASLPPKGKGSPFPSHLATLSPLSLAPMGSHRPPCLCLWQGGSHTKQQQDLVPCFVLSLHVAKPRLLRVEEHPGVQRFPTYSQARISWWAGCPL